MENYRPISICSLVGKVLKRKVRDRMAAFLGANNVIPGNQHGFRTRRSCMTLLAGLFDSWAAILDQKSGAHLSAVFLDFSKAFDRVPHRRLLSKLDRYGVRGLLQRWLESFLVGRTQHVRFNGACSSPSEVPSGVIQGSVLGPLLFNIYVADLPSVVKSARLEQYADDCSLSKEIENQEDADALQEDLDNVSRWCQENGLTLNAKKCKAMDITRARIPCRPMYKIGSTVLDYVDSERLLGVHISKDLRWNGGTPTRTSSGRRRHRRSASPPAT
jgi:Reverse transcriptase (RNA-dependent DNA polymerase)